MRHLANPSECKINQFFENDCKQKHFFDICEKILLSQKCLKIANLLIINYLTKIQIFANDFGLFGEHSIVCNPLF